MNKNLGSIMIGAGIGTIIGYLIADWYIEFKMLNVCDEEDVSPVEKFNRRWTEEVTVDELDNTVTRVRRNKLVSNNKSEKKDYTALFIANGQPDLAALAAKYRGETVNVTNVPAREEEEIEGLHDMIDGDIIEEEGPIIISMEEYASDDELDHITLNYYDDDVLIGEQNEIISDPEEILGPDALVSFGGFSHDEDTVYVRNSKNGTMYEVVRTGRNYSAPVPQRRLSLRERANVKEKNNGETEEGS